MSHWYLTMRVWCLVSRVWYLDLSLRGFRSLGEMTSRVPRAHTPAAMEARWINLCQSSDNTSIIEV